MPEKPILKNKQDSENIPEFTLQKQYLDLIKTEQKTVEGRINSGGFSNLQVGSKVKFFEGKNPKSFVVCEILEVNSYSTFREMLEAEGVENMLPGVASLEKGVQIYEKIPGYKERCQRSGCVGLKIRVLEQS